MNDFFEETVELRETHNAEKKRKIHFGFSVFFTLLAAGLLVMLPVSNCQSFDFLVFAAVAVPLAASVFFAVFFMKKSTKAIVEYDYLLRDRALVIVKIFNRSSRKVAERIDYTAVRAVGKYKSDAFNRFMADERVSLTKHTPNDTPAEGKGFYYVYFAGATGGELAVLECSPAFIGQIYRSLPHNSNITIEDLR